MRTEVGIDLTFAYPPVQCEALEASIVKYKLGSQKQVQVKVKPGVGSLCRLTLTPDTAKLS